MPLLGQPQADKRDDRYQGANTEIKVVSELGAGKSRQEDAPAGEHGSQLALAIEDEIRHLPVKEQDQQAEEQPSKFNYHAE